MKFQPAYNCMLGCFYNELTIRHKLQFSLEKWLLRPNYFQIIHCMVHGYSKISGPHAGELIDQFQSEFPAIRTMIPEFHSVEESLKYAREFISEHGFISAAHNLKHAPFESTSYNSDSWNYLMITEFMENKTCQLYSPYNNEYAVISEEQLELMLDTPFNYRKPTIFTPFMYWECSDPVSVQSAMNLLNEIELFQTAVEHYPLDFNLNEGRIYIDSLQLIHEHVPPEEMKMQVNEIHAFQRIVLRSRQDLFKYLSSMNIGADQEMNSLIDKWARFNHLTAMTILRKNSVGFEQLHHVFEQLIRMEKDVLERLSKRIEPAS